MSNTANECHCSSTKHTNCNYISFSCSLHCHIPCGTFSQKRALYWYRYWFTWKPHQKQLIINLQLEYNVLTASPSLFTNNVFKVLHFNWQEIFRRIQGNYFEIAWNQFCIAAAIFYWIDIIIRRFLMHQTRLNLTHISPRRHRLHPNRSIPTLS